MFRAGDTVIQNGHHLWNITKYENEYIYYDVVYKTHVSPNSMHIDEWHKFSVKYKWVHVPKKDVLPEELFTI